MQSRRDLLKYFAAGTVITPLAGAGPLAMLIEEPKIELIKPGLRETLLFAEVKSVTISFHMADGTLRSISGEPEHKDGLLMPGDEIEIYCNRLDSSSPSRFSAYFRAKATVK